MAEITWDQYDGYIHSNQVSNKLRESNRPRAKLRQFANLPDELDSVAPNKGERFYWNIIQKPTMLNFRLAETDRIQSSSLDQTQNSIVVTEMGRAIERTQKADTLSMNRWSGIIENGLSYMAAHQFEAECYLALKGTPLWVVPTGGTSTTSVTLTTSGTTVTTNNVAMGTGHIKAITDAMKGRNMAPDLTREAYICVAGISTLRPIKNQLESINQYTPEGYSKISFGEIGRYEDMVFVEQNFIPAGGAVDSTTFDPYTDTADAWNNGLSDWAIFLGADALTEAAVIPEEIRAKLPEDYGRDKGAAWYYLGGFALTRPAAADADVVFWGSAA